MVADRQPRLEWKRVRSPKSEKKLGGSGQGRDIQKGAG